MVHGFSEYQYGYQRLTTVRAAKPGDSPLLARCHHRHLGLGVPYSCNNVFHQLFHAVPVFEQFAPLVAASEAAGHTFSFIPLVYPSTSIGRRMSDDPRNWHAWEFSLRPLTSMSSAQLAAETASLVSSCTCFERIEANVPAFNPLSRSATPRLRAFRKAALRSIRQMWRRSTPSAMHFAAPLSPGGSDDSLRQDFLWIVRKHHRRNIQNERELALRLRENKRVQRVVLETMPLAEQMVLFSRSLGLVTVHGQAMTWVLFLGSHSSRLKPKVAAVEIMPRGLISHIYRDLSRTLGAFYQEVAALPVSGCGGGSTDAKLACNITVNIESVRLAVNRAAAYTAWGS